ncbi:MAG: hypothetical protein DLM55_06790 [Acidimicrobiales bacterium]|nr:MAG: hypothetical protein DLM55_06790 [Acidimicrobiales bacterium]
MGNGRLRVKSAYGFFTADWHGEKPSLGTSHSVEIDVNDLLLWGRDLRVADTPAQEIADDEDMVRISGRIESFDSDDVLTLLVDNSLIMVETEGDPPLGAIGRYATLRSAKITLYPYDV